MKKVSHGAAAVNLPPNSNEKSQKLPLPALSIFGTRDTGANPPENQYPVTWRECRYPATWRHHLPQWEAWMNSRRDDALHEAARAQLTMRREDHAKVAELVEAVICTECCPYHVALACVALDREIDAGGQ